MVLPYAMSVHRETARPPLSIPTIDMSAPGRDALSRLMVRACAEFGFFRAVNHGVAPRLTARLEAASAEFFSRATPEKQRAGLPSPLGYGSRNIGPNGDVGELEYLILHTDPAVVAQKATTIDGEDPPRLSEVVNEYVEAVRQLACEILELLGEGLGLKDPKSLRRLITDPDNDSLLRINHYPPSCTSHKHDHEDPCAASPKAGNSVGTAGATIGFGEHTDPQILSVLWANDDGLQVLLPDDEGKDAWVNVPADPSAFFINVGDLLQALTNGKLVSIRHRVVASSCQPRLSTIYFAAPPIHARISVLPETVTANSPCRYMPFTWAEYKKVMYSLSLSHSRLNLFHVEGSDRDNVGEGDQE